MPIYSDREFDHVLKKHADQLVVVCASSTDCKPCQSFEPVFDVSNCWYYFTPLLDLLAVLYNASLIVSVLLIVLGLALSRPNVL